MADEKLSGKVGLDTTDFKTNVAAMNRELRVLESGFRASAAGLGDWAKDASGLEMRIKSLTSQMEVQKNKVSAVRAEYERVAAEKGATSKAAQDLEIKLNKETETLNKMNSELGETENALGEMQGETDEAAEGLEKMGKEAEETGNKSETLKNVLSGLWTGLKVGIGVLAAAATAVLAVGAALVKLVLSSAEAAGELVDLSAKTGISTTRLQELTYAGDQLGVSIETITGANAKLIRSMDDAKTGTGAQAEAFAALGVSVTDSNGKLRDSQAVFGEVLDALQKIDNPTERDAVAMALFGKSAQDLNPLIKAGSDELTRLSDEANKMGAVMSEDAVNGLEAFGDTLASLKAGVKGTLGTLAAAILPAFQGVATGAQGYLQEVVAVVQGSGGDITKMLNGYWVMNPETGRPERNAGILGILTSIVEGIAEKLPALAETGIGILQTILGSIVANLPALLQAASGIITALVGFLVEALPVLMETGIQLLLTLVMAIIENLPMLIDAAFQMIITLVQGLAAALPTLIPAIVEMLVLIITTILDNLPMLLEAALQLILGLVQGLAAALPILIAAVPTIMIAIVNTLTEMLPVLVEMAPEIIVSVITGIIGALPALAEAIPQIITTIIKVLTELLPDMLKAGGQILGGIWSGISAALPQFMEKVKAFAKSIWSTIKAALGIKSPSALFAETVGPNIPLGIWEGIKKEMPNLQSQLNQAMLGLNASLVVGEFGPGQASNSNVTNITVQIPNAQIASTVDIKKLAYSVANEIARRQ